MITFFRQLAFEDFWLKLFSFALAILMWFTISSAIQPGDSSTPLSFTSEAQRRTFTSVPVVILSSGRLAGGCKILPQSVEVTVKGDPKILAGLKDEDIQAVVNLVGIEGGSDIVKRLKITSPATVSVLKADPEEVQVVFPRIK
jgi:YbbR domain-containing protein